MADNQKEKGFLVVEDQKSLKKDKAILRLLNKLYLKYRTATG